MPASSVSRLRERFSFDIAGGVVPGIGFNVGEVSHPLGGNGYIRDDSARALYLSDKLTDPVF
jgi:hypothetical protein